MSRRRQNVSSEQRDDIESNADMGGDIKKADPTLLRLIPLGGLGEIGKNMMAIESGENILIVDVGLMFPNSDMYGVDVVIPDAEYVLERLDWIQAIVLTHGHEDHIGGLPYLMEQGLYAPIYATGLTRGLVEGKLREHKLLEDADLHTITSDDKLEVGPFKIEFFHTCHSFPNSVGLCVDTPAGRLVHTSDYRLDPTPVDEKPTEEDKLKRWGDEGVLVLLADSTNAEQEDTTPSEKSIEPMLEEAFGDAKGRILLTTFASNLSRVRQIIDISKRHGRRVGVIGRSMINNVKIAIQQGYLDITQDELLSPGEMESNPPSQVVVIATGSQGEPTSAMVRMSIGDHRQITLREGDTIIVSASPIPGNEELFNRTLDNLFRQGAEIRYHQLDDVHVSGHGGRADYRRIFELVRPKYFMPVHGEYRHLVLHGRLAHEMGLPKENIFAVEDGQIVEFGRYNSHASDGQDEDESGEVTARLGRRIQSHHIFVDGLGVGDIGNVVLRDRRHLSENGFMVCIAVLDEYDGAILYGPEIVSRGFVYMRESEDLIRRAEKAVNKVLKKRAPGRVLEDKMKDVLTNFCHREMGRRPIVLPIVLEV